MISFLIKYGSFLHVPRMHACCPSEHSPFLCQTDAPTVHTENTTFPYGFSMIPMWRTWCAVRVPPARAVVHSRAGRLWAGTTPWNCSFSQGFIRVSEKLSVLENNYQFDILGTAAASGIPRGAPQKRMIFHGFPRGPSWDPAGAPWPASRQ